MRCEHDPSFWFWHGLSSAHVHAAPFARSAATKLGTAGAACATRRDSSLPQTHGPLSVVQYWQSPVQSASAVHALPQTSPETATALPLRQSLVPGVHVPLGSGFPATSVRDMHDLSFRFMHGAASAVQEHDSVPQSSVPAAHWPPDDTGLPMGSMRCEHDPSFWFWHGLSSAHVHAPWARSAVTKLGTASAGCAM